MDMGAEVPCKMPQNQVWRGGGRRDGGGGRGAGGGGRGAGGRLEGLLEEEVAYEPLVALVEPARPGPTSADGGPPAAGPAASPVQHQGRVQIRADYREDKWDKGSDDAGGQARHGRRRQVVETRAGV